MKSPEKLSESLEDYLEVIFHLIKEKKAARVRDISRRLKVNMSSVSGALHTLAKKELVNYTPYEVVTLTPAGKKIAREVVRRHEALRDFLVKVLAVDERLADETACKMEHVVTKGILEKFVKFMEFVETCPVGGAKWINGFGYKCSHRDKIDECKQCADICREESEKDESQE